MNLPPINLPPLSSSEAVTPQTLPAALRGWQVGQILHATVIERPTPETTMLRFGRTEIPVHTRLPLTPGETVKVRVENLAVPITLRLLAARQEAAATVAEALRTALPRQQSFAPLLANLSRLLAPRGGEPDGGRAAPLPVPLRQALQRLFDALPEARQWATPQGVRQALRDSGLFAEARLAQSAARQQPPPAADTKLNLVRLLDAVQTVLRAAPAPAPAAADRPLPPPLALPVAPPLREQPPVAQPRAEASVAQLLQENAALIRIVQELAAQLEGALVRLQVSQLASLPDDQQPAQVWVAEVPVRHAGQTDLFQLRIEHRRAGSTPGEEYWSITFAFALEELGAVRARVVFHQQALSATLWAEREQTARRFKERLAELRARIEGYGLPLRNLDCVAGLPETDAPSHPGAGLIDTQV